MTTIQQLMKEVFDKTAKRYMISPVNVWRYIRAVEDASELPGDFFQGWKLQGNNAVDEISIIGKTKEVIATIECDEHRGIYMGRITFPNLRGLQKEFAGTHFQEALETVSSTKKEVDHSYPMIAVLEMADQHKVGVNLSHEQVKYLLKEIRSIHLDNV